MRTIDNQMNINEISSRDKYDDVKCNIEHDLESEAVEVRTRMRRRGASSILETGLETAPSVEVWRLYVSPLLAA